MSSFGKCPKYLGKKKQITSVMSRVFLFVTEYSTNLRNSGVHGALIALDTSFTSDDLASALGIPINKATVRRHLASEFDMLVKQARYVLNFDIL